MEILFENSDLRIPTGKPEVSIKRTLTRQGDHFSIDGKMLTRGELSSLLQAAGFSQSNPFYIVPQGRITALTNAKDEERLALLKEIAGMTIYETHRAEAAKILSESDSRIAKIRELLSAITERYEELTKEQQQLTAIERADEERRALDYTLLSREQAEVQSALEAQGGIPTTEDNSTTLKTLEERVSRAQEARKTFTQAVEFTQTLLRQQHAIVRERRAVLLEDNREDVTVPSIFSASNGEIAMSGVPIVSHAIHNSADAVCRLENERSALEAQEKAMEQDLAICMTRLEKYAEEEGELEMRIAQEKSCEPGGLVKLYAELENAISIKSSLLAERIRHQEQQNQLTEALANQEQNIIPETQASLQTAKARAAQLSTARRALWQEEAKSRSILPAMQEEMLSMERELFATVQDRSISLGLATLRRLLTDLDNENQCSEGLLSRPSEHKPFSTGVLGPLYELISGIDPVYDAAIEAVAGTQLFHIIVENDAIAASLVSALASRHAGRLTFVPLNVINEALAERFLLGNDPSEVDGVLPLINVISTRDPRIEPILHSIFGRTMLVESLDGKGSMDGVPQLSSPHHSLVTLEGDRRDRRGALTGGYVDPRRSRLALVRRIMALRDEKIAPILATLASIEERGEKIDREAAHLAGSMAQLEVALHRHYKVAERLKTELAAGQRFANEKFNVDIGELEAELALLRVRQNRLLNPQKDTNWAKEDNSHISPSQKNVAIENMEAKLLSLRLGGERDTLRQQMERLRAELTIRVRGRLKTITTQELPAARNATALLEISRAQQTEWQAQSKALLMEAEQGSAAMELELEQHSKALAQAVMELEAAEAALEAAHAAHAHDTAASTRLNSQRSIWTMRLQEIDRRIRELGHIPATQLETLRSERTQVLRARLGSLNQSQFGISAIAGRRAAGEQQLATMAKQRTTLQEREGELAASAAAIQSYISTLDCQKDAVVLRTFESLAAAFTEIFTEIVPGGSASLILTRRFVEQDENDGFISDPLVHLPEASQNANPQKSQKGGQKKVWNNTSKISKGNSFTSTSEGAESLEPASSTTIQAAEWAGIAVEASFAPGAPSASTELLSGGQKSVIACALIFAIQRCDPAPFYIFDEIDANLDAPHRAAIASMIARLSSPSAPPSTTTGAQFLVTTFRPELAMYADTFFSISLLSRVSRIREIGREEALDFITRDSE